MGDILLHSSKEHFKATRFRKNYRPAPTTIQQGVSLALALFKQTMKVPVKDGNKL